MEKFTNKEAMIEDITQYYEAAGFIDVETKIIEGKTDEELEELYNEITRI